MQKGKDPVNFCFSIYCLCLPNGFILSNFQIKNFSAFAVSHMGETRPVQVVLFYFIAQQYMGKSHRSNAAWLLSRLTQFSTSCSFCFILFRSSLNAHTEAKYLLIIRNVGMCVSHSFCSLDVVKETQVFGSWHCSDTTYISIHQSETPPVHAMKTQRW
jgi:hypothetical protein